MNDPLLLHRLRLFLLVRKEQECVMKRSGHNQRVTPWERKRSNDRSLKNRRNQLLSRNGKLGAQKGRWHSHDNKRKMHHNLPLPVATRYKPQLAPKGISYLKKAQSGP